MIRFSRSVAAVLLWPCRSDQLDFNPSKMESSKVCLLLIALGATLAAVAAEPAPMHYYKTPTWWWKPPPVYNAPLYLKSTGFATNLPDPEVCTLGASAYFQ